MGALARNIKNIQQMIANSAIYKMFSEMREGFSAMVTEEPEVESVVAPELQAAIDKTFEKVEKQLGVVPEIQKDADGYNKIPNKLEGIEANVSEVKAQVKADREKGGEQKTRVDE